MIKLGLADVVLWVFFHPAARDEVGPREVYDVVAGRASARDQVGADCMMCSGEIASAMQPVMKSGCLLLMIVFLMLSLCWPAGPPVPVIKSGSG